MYLFMYLDNIKRHLTFCKVTESVFYTNDYKLTRPEGIEPPSQEPESYVISTTLRTQTLG